MKKILIGIMLTVNLNLGYGQNAALYDSLKADSVSHLHMVDMAPYMKQRFESFGGAIYRLNNDRMIANSAGEAVTNVLCGMVPGVSGSSENIGWRTYRYPLIVIDGVPFNSTVTSVVNLNTFEYSDATVLGSMVTTAPYGMVGSDGAIVLKSKSGEGFTQPAFEFNSNTSFYAERGFRENIAGKEKYKMDYLTTSNSFAYKQDFGAVDTRISINHYSTPYWKQNDGSTFHNNRYGIRMNNGFLLGKRFNARIMADYISYREKQRLNIHSIGRDEEDIFLSQYVEDSNGYFNSQLQLQYSPLAWLHVKSNAAWQKRYVDRDWFSDTQGYLSDISNEYLNDKRFLVNTFLNVEKEILKGFSVSSFVGVQVESQDVLITNTSGSSSGVSSEAYHNAFQSVVLGVSTNVKNRWYVNFIQHRMNKPVSYSEDRNKLYSISSSFVLSELLSSMRLLSSGKVRVGFANTDFTMPQRYPFKRPDPFDLTTVPDFKRVMEAGLDLAALKDKLEMSFTWYRGDLAETVLIRRPFDYDVPYFDNYVSESVNNGVEVIVRGTPVKRKSLTVYSSFLMNNYKYEAEMRSDNILLKIGSEKPQWNYSYLNQVTWRRLNVNFLLYSSVQREMYTSFFTTLHHFKKVSALRLREVSAGYSFDVSSARIFRVAEISLIGRNLWLIHSNLNEADRIIVWPEAQKYVSLNVNLAF